jgi:ankyrin repeat protein
MPASAPKFSTSHSTKALCAAVKNNDPSAAKAAIADGANPSFYYPRGSSLLMIAAENARLDLFRVLMEAGANPMNMGPSGATVLTCALSVMDRKSNKDTYEIVKLLFELLTPPQRAFIIDKAPSSILHYAVNCGHGSRLCALLIRSGVPIDTIDRHDRTMLHFLAQEHYKPQLMSLFINSGAPLNARSDNNFTPLQSAIRVGNYQAAEQLLAAGADPNLVDCDELSALHWCAVYATPDLISLVLAHGADPSLKDNLGRTAEGLALSEGYLEAYETLRRHRELKTLKQAVDGPEPSPRVRL